MQIGRGEGAGHHRGGEPGSGWRAGDDPWSRLSVQRYCQRLKGGPGPPPGCRPGHPGRASSSTSAHMRTAPSLATPARLPGGTRCIASIRSACSAHRAVAAFGSTSNRRLRFASESSPVAGQVGEVSAGTSCSAAHARNGTSPSGSRSGGSVPAAAPGRSGPPLELLPAPNVADRERDDGAGQLGYRRSQLGAMFRSLRPSRSAGSTASASRRRLPSCPAPRTLATHLRLDISFPPRWSPTGQRCTSRVGRHRRLW